MRKPIKIQTALLAWYETYGRKLPWRDLHSHSNEWLRDPYHILVSELMLQQTQVSRVLPKYEAFVHTWPTLFDLSRAKLSDILIAWKGLGYNRRAKYLLELSVIVTHQHDGKIPSDLKTLLKLPGIGPYTASALLVFAFGQQATVIDTNVSRVISRVFVGMKQCPLPKLHEIALQVLPQGKADQWHQCLMDFGALVCLSNHATCDVCPIALMCTANRQAKTLGYVSFAQYKETVPITKKYSKKDNGKKFIETDRYFRGRIIDSLRNGEMSMMKLQEIMGVEYKLSDRVRFGKLIESLVIERLISITGNQVSLG